MPIAIGTILIFSFFFSRIMSEQLVRSPKGETLIDVFRPREDDGAY